MHKHNLPKAKKRFGQNFLQDQNIIRKILHKISPTPKDIFVEIGPGTGAITEPLLNACKVLHAIEIDQDLYPILEEKFSQYNNFTLHKQDALTFSLDNLIEVEQDSSTPEKKTSNTKDKPSNKLRIVGNLPYNISTPLLFHLVNYFAVIQDIHVMLQKEVVDRIVAAPNHKNYGRLSVILQYFFDTELVINVPRTVFVPVPKVESAIVKLIPKPKSLLTAKDLKVFTELVSKAFNQRRKTITNSLKGVISPQQLAQANIPSTARAENISLAQFISLSNLIT